MWIRKRGREFKPYLPLFDEARQVAETSFYHFREKQKMHGAYDPIPPPLPSVQLDCYCGKRNTRSPQTICWEAFVPMYRGIRCWLCIEYLVCMPTDHWPLELMVCGRGGPSVWPIMACCYVNNELLSSCTNSLLYRALLY